MFWNSRIFGSREGLNRAMQVVEKDFAVVGILEDWDKTLAVLEHYIPRYFKGATKMYQGKTLQNLLNLMNDALKVFPFFMSFLSFLRAT